jgi:hypothetical protein
MKRLFDTLSWHDAPFGLVCVIVAWAGCTDSFWCVCFPGQWATVAILEESGHAIPDNGVCLVCVSRGPCLAFESRANVMAAAAGAGLGQVQLPVLGGVHGRRSEASEGSHFWIRRVKDTAFGQRTHYQCLDSKGQIIV